MVAGEEPGNLEGTSLTHRLVSVKGLLGDNSVSTLPTNVSKESYSGPERSVPVTGPVTDSTLPSHHTHPKVSTAKVSTANAVNTLLKACRDGEVDKLPSIIANIPDLQTVIKGACLAMSQIGKQSNSQGNTRVFGSSKKVQFEDTTDPTHLDRVGEDLNKIVTTLANFGATAASVEQAQRGIRAQIKDLPSKLHQIDNQLRHFKTSSQVASDPIERQKQLQGFEAGNHSIELRLHLLNLVSNLLSRAHHSCSEKDPESVKLLYLETVLEASMRKEADKLVSEQLSKALILGGPNTRLGINTILRQPPPLSPTNSKFAAMLQEARKRFKPK